MRKASPTMLRGLDPKPYVWSRKKELVCGADWAAQVEVECILEDPTGMNATMRLTPGSHWLIWRSDIRRLTAYTDEDFRRNYTPMGSWEKPVVVVETYDVARLRNFETVDLGPVRLIGGPALVHDAARPMRLSEMLPVSQKSDDEVASCPACGGPVHSAVVDGQRGFKCATDPCEWSGLGATLRKIGEDS